MQNNKPMRICIDLDGTICEFKTDQQNYSDVLPKEGAKEMIEQLRESGNTIIIYTARNMKTQNHNVGKVVKNIGKITLDWLEKHQIHYDEIFFGKPNADLIIDDRCFRFDSWKNIDEKLIRSLAKDE